MIYARQIIQRVNLVTLLGIGWVLAVLQAGLAIEIIFDSLRHLKIISRKVSIPVPSLYSKQ